MLLTLRTLCRPLSLPLKYMQGTSETISFEEELGFMHKVKEEIEKLNKMLIYMGWLFQRKYRVILFVDDLDRCSYRKTAAMLNAIKIMQAKNANNKFVFIVAAGKQHLLDSLESDDIYLGSQTGQYYLDNLFDIPFAVPKFENGSGKQFLEQRRQQIQKDTTDGKDTNESQPTRNLNKDSNGLPASAVRSSEATTQICNDVIDILEEYSDYLSENLRAKERILLTCQLAALAGDECGRVELRNVVLAVILFDVWPFRSNLLYHYEESGESGAVTVNHVLTYGTSIFLSQTEKSSELVSCIKMGLTLKDGKGERFRELAGHWTMDRLRQVIPYTLNRDKALKNRIEKALAEIKMLT